MAGPLRVNPAIVIPEAELQWRFSRSSGPGGQGVNTTDSRVQLRWDVARSLALTADERTRLLARLGPRLVDGVLQVASSEQRSQRQNRETAERRLAESSPPRSPRRPGPGAGPSRRGALWSAGSRVSVDVPT
jgi:ribosome-associated protein